jgi:transcriptional regulator with XRE-family HTH domain
MSSAQPREVARSGYWKTAGQLLSRLRDRHGWSYQELADRAGVTADLVVAYELARVRYPELEACWRITAALGVSLPAFLDQVTKVSGVSLVAGVRPSGFGGSTGPRRTAIQPEQDNADALSSFVNQLHPSERKDGDPK